MNIEIKIPETYYTRRVRLYFSCLLPVFVLNFGWAFQPGNTNLGYVDGFFFRRHPEDDHCGKPWREP